ncbi:DUF4279 domain-containing protein [Nocardioides sp.]|uniref:DUF4279 domain-containing protein n=1 Tax=Nocardioides sp. TaxID=35761 RepID=UPI002616FFDB|nr:DUF4279 domain-containing protein [Nocardioides sp.]
MIRAYLRVASSDLRLAEITEFLGIQPDDSHDIGDQSLSRPTHRYLWSSWQRHLDLGESISGGTEGLSSAIEGLEFGLADALGVLAARSCDVALVVVQELDDRGDTGLHLTAPAIRWLARAGALVDVDQYVEGASFSRAASNWIEGRMWDLRKVRWALLRGGGVGRRNGQRP